MNKSLGYMKVLAVFLTCTVMMSGCIRLKGNTVFEYVPNLPKGQVPVKVTVEEFEDLRAEADKKRTRDIEPVARKVSRKIYEDFKDSELFEKIFSGENEAADIIVKGRISNFYWKNSYKWYAFVPYLNLILLFGVPAGQFKGEVKLTVDLVTHKSGVLIASYEEYSMKEDTYSGYRSFWGLTAGAETSEAFRLTVENIKTRILNDKEKILAAI